jgi:hypothetical protein
VRNRELTRNAKNPEKKGCCSIASATGCQRRRTKQLVEKNWNSPKSRQQSISGANSFGAVGRFIARSVVGPRLRVLLISRTSAALIPSNASPYPTPSSMMRRNFWVSAMRVYLVVSGGSFPTVISAGSSWRFRLPAATLIRTQCGHDLILQSADSG